MELAELRTHHHPFHFVRTFTFTTCQVTSPFYCGETFKEQWAHGTQRGNDLFYTVLINYNSFFHNKRCRRSNYSVKHVCSRGDRTACYQLKQNEGFRAPREMPELSSKISHLYVISTFLLPSFTCTQSQTQSPASCQSLHVMWSAAESLFPFLT